MIILRRILAGLGVLVIVWIAASIGGLIFDPGRMQLWSSSLIGAFLASLLIVPALVMLYDDTLISTDSSSRASSEQKAFTDTETSSSLPEKEQEKQ